MSQEKNNAVVNPFFRKSPDDVPLTCHVFCITSCPSNAKHSLSHFAQKVRNLCWILKSTGNTVKYYGYESCDVECDEKIVVLSEDILKEAYPNYDKGFGHVDINVPPKNPKAIEYLEQRWTLEVEYQVQQRYSPNDFFFWMLPMCGQRFLYRRLKDLPVRHVEPGIGYVGAYLPHKIFQSTFMRDFHYGGYHNNKHWYDESDESFKKQGYFPHYLRTYVDWETPPRQDAVIPNAYDLSLFDFRVKKKEYLLCLARLLSKKGIRQAVEIAERSGMQLIVAGPGDFEASVGRSPSSNVEVRGVVGPDERRDLLSHARAVLSLSEVHETFGGAAIEAMLSGTVPIVANTGGFLDTVRSGYNGYRIPFNDIQAGVDAVQNIDRIDPYMLRDAGLRFSREQCALKHNAYIQNLDRVLKSKDPEAFLTEPGFVNYDEEIEWPDGWMTPVDVGSEVDKGVKDAEDI